MSDASSSVQALGALGVSLNATAHNIANASTEGYRSLRTDFADGPGGQGVVVADVSRAKDPGVDIATQMVGLMETSQAYSANVTMVRAADETTGVLLNAIA